MLESGRRHIRAITGMERIHQRKTSDMMKNHERKIDRVGRAVPTKV